MLSVLVCYAAYIHVPAGHMKTSKVRRGPGNLESGVTWSELFLWLLRPEQTLRENFVGSSIIGPHKISLTASVLV